MVAAGISGWKQRLGTMGLKNSFINLSNSQLFDGSLYMQRVVFTQEISRLKLYSGQDPDTLDKSWKGKERKGGF